MADQPTSPNQGSPNQGPDAFYTQPPGQPAAAPEPVQRARTEGGPQRFFPVTIRGFEFVDGEPREAVLTGHLGFTGGTYDLLFTECGHSAEAHDRARFRFQQLVEKVTGKTATPDEMAELVKTTVPDLFGSDRTNHSVATDLIYCGLKAALPDLTRDRVAALLDGKQTALLTQQAVVPAFFAYYGGDMLRAQARAEEAKRLAAELQASVAAVPDLDVPAVPAPELGPEAQAHALDVAVELDHQAAVPGHVPDAGETDQPEADQAGTDQGEAPAPAQP